MTNEQIIAEIALQVYGEDAVMEMMAKGIEIPLHTVQGWASRGPYKVKKGEHGIETRLWKKKKEKVSNQSEDDDSQNFIEGNFYLCKSFLFRADQIERVNLNE